MPSPIPRAPRVLALALSLLAACGGDGGQQIDGSGGGQPATTGSTAGAATGTDASATAGGGTGPGGGPVSSTGTAPSGTGVAPNLDGVILDDCGSDNPAGLGADQVSALKAGGSGAPRVLYPYDGTVFPRGLTSPTLMWEGGGEAAYVHIESALFEYHGCLPVQGGSVHLPQQAWDMAGVQTGGGPRDPFVMQLSTLAGGSVSGPAEQQFIIAKGSLRGSIYINSYNTQLGGGGGGFGGEQGAILRIQPGRSAEFFLRDGQCTGCHSLSANGTRMLTADQDPLGFDLLGWVNGTTTSTVSGKVMEITPTTGPNAPVLRNAVDAAFAGLTPDGRYYLSSSASGILGPRLSGATIPVVSSQLFETDTGSVVDAGIPTSAMMPTFSADGTLLAFNDHTQNGARSLQLMDFDPAAATASNLRTVFTSQEGYVGWPFVMPDNRGVVFTVTERADFGGAGWGISHEGNAPWSDLMFLDLESGEAHILARAMGYATLPDAEAENTYLPFGEPELHKAYYPTVSPVAAGGYFWVFFDSIRHYGNQGLRRQVWGTAIEIPKTVEFNQYADDPSRPPFYVEGQELDVANHRAFTVLDPCKADGESCESGVDCCSGFCTDGVCGYEVPRCSEDGEACETAADCCDDAYQCIAGFCSIVLL